MDRVEVLGYLTAPLWVPILLVGILFGLLRPICIAAFDYGTEVGQGLFGREYSQRAATPMQRETQDAPGPSMRNA